MVREQISLDDVIQLLNGLVHADQNGITCLVEQRVPCNDKLGRHPTVQTSTDEEGHLVFGLLGILNGVFGVDDEGWGPIMAVFEDRADGCSVITKFQKTEDWKRCHSSDVNK